MASPSPSAVDVPFAAPRCARFYGLHHLEAAFRAIVCWKNSQIAADLSPGPEARTIELASMASKRIKSWDH